MRSLRLHGAIRGCPPAHIGGTLIVTPERYSQGNTEGRPATMKASDASYLAGFLDGDGSIHFQLVRQREYRFGYYIRASMSQSTSARHGWSTSSVWSAAGTLRDRGTGMSDLVVTSRPLLIELLQAVSRTWSSSESTYAERSGCCRSLGLGSTPRSSCGWRERWTPSLP
jgi:hypothetical protein